LVRLKEHPVLVAARGTLREDAGDGSSLLDPDLHPLLSRGLVALAQAIQIVRPATAGPRHQWVTLFTMLTTQAQLDQFAALHRQPARVNGFVGDSVLQCLCFQVHDADQGGTTFSTAPRLLSFLNEWVWQVGQENERYVKAYGATWKGEAASSRVTRADVLACGTASSVFDRHTNTFSKKKAVGGVKDASGRWTFDRQLLGESLRRTGATGWQGLLAGLGGNRGNPALPTIEVVERGD
jgi:hypothetical protein